MKFYGIESEGKFRVPTVTTLPTYDYTKHKGTLYYQTSDDVVYQGIGDAGGSWVRTGIASVTVLPPGDEEEGDPNEEGLLLYVQETGLLYYRTVDRWIVINGQIANNLTLYISTTGNDTTGDGTEALPWYSINTAFDWLHDKYIAHGKTVTIQLDDGSYNYTETQICNHPNGSRIIITGKNSYSRMMTAIVNTTGTVATPAVSETGNFVQAVITLNDTSNISTNDYVLLKNCFTNNDAGVVISNISGELRESRSTPDYSGRGEPIQLQGVFKVANVSGNNITINVIYRQGNNLFQNITIPIGAYQAEVTVIKTVLSFTGVAGIMVDGSNTLGNETVAGLDKVIVYSTDAYLDDNHYWNVGVGISSVDNSYLHCGTSVGALNWWYAFASNSGAHLTCEYCCATGNTHGLYVSTSANCNGWGFQASGCSKAITVNRGASVYAWASIAVSCFVAFNSHNAASGGLDVGVVSNCFRGFSGSQTSALQITNSCIYKCITGIYGYRNSYVQSGGVNKTIINGCTTGITAESGTLITAKATNMTYSGNTTDTVPAVNVIGADGGLIVAT